MSENPELKRLVELSVENFNELGVVGEPGDLYLPTKLKTRKADGGISTVDVLLKQPTNKQRVRARIESRAMAVKSGLDLKEDTDLVTEMENYHLLWFALRDPKSKGQFAPTVQELWDKFTDATMAECHVRLSTWTDMQDPRYGYLSEDKLWQCAYAIAEDGNMLPLAGMRGYEQASCISAMAAEALKSPKLVSWLSSHTTSKQSSSPEEKST